MNMGMEVEAYDIHQHIEELKDAIKVANTKLCNKDEEVNRFMRENFELKAKIQILKEIIKELNHG